MDSIDSCINANLFVVPALIRGRKYHMSPPPSEQTFESYADGSAFLELLGSKGKARMIDVFVGKRNERLTAQEVADLAGIDRSTFDRNIQSFLDLGIVDLVEPAGNARRYQLDSNHTVSQLLGALQEGLLGHVESLHGLESRSPSGQSPVLAPTGKADRAVSTQGSEVLRVLGEPQNQEILAAATRPLSAQELSEILDIPIAATYRRIDELTEQGLLELVGRPLSDEHRRINVYERSVDEISVEFVDEEITIDLTTHASPVRLDATLREEDEGVAEAEDADEQL